MTKLRFRIIVEKDNVVIYDKDFENKGDSNRVVLEGAKGSMRQCELEVLAVLIPLLP